MNLYEIYKLFGIAAIISLIITVFLGFNIRRSGFKIHRFFALLTLTLAVIHFILQKF